MKKNTSGQFIGVQMITAADGTAFTGAVTNTYTIDGGTQTAGATVTHEGNGFHTMPVSATLSNGDHIGFTFTGTGAIPAAVQVYTAFPQTVDNDVRLAANNTLLLDIPTVSEFNARTILAGSYFDPAADAVANVTLVATTTTNTDMVAEAPSAADIADAVWDEPLTGATHNVPTSSGRRLRSIGDATSGTVNDASATTTSFISTLTGAHDDHYADQTLFFTDGDLSGMSRIITTYTAATKEVTFDEALPAPPGDGDGFDVNPVHVHTQTQIAEVVWDEILSKSTHNIGQSAGKRLRQGSDLVQIDGAVTDASPTVIDFDTNLTQIDDYFEDAVLIFSNGAANAGIGRPVVEYSNTNGNMTFLAPDDWPVTPVNGDDFVIYATHVHPITQIQDGLATEAKQDIIDTNVDAIKAKTDNLTFTTTNEVDSNVQSVNDVVVTGTGASGDEWGP